MFHLIARMLVSDKLRTIPVVHRGTVKQHAKEIFKYAISRAQPDVLVKNVLQVDKDNNILVRNKCYSTKNKTVHVVGVGKAAIGMAATVNDILKDKLSDGIVLVPCGSSKSDFDEKETKIDRLLKDGKFKVFEAARNNLPDADSVNATNEIIDYLKAMNENDILITLISGGASALLCAPTHPVTVAEKRTVIQLLTSRGADIRELNVVRQQLSLVKGGKLGDIARPASIMALIMSDVVGDPLEIIGSGPTVGCGANKYIEAQSIIDKYNLNEQLPSSVLEVFEKSRHLGGDACRTRRSAHVDNYLIGNNETVLEAAATKANELGYATHVLSNTIGGNSASLGKLYAGLGRFLANVRADDVESKSDAVRLDDLLVEHGVVAGADRLAKLISMSKRSCDRLAVISGGETVVNVAGDGKGGRNQEAALSCCIALKASFPENVRETVLDDMLFLSVGTDGIDGPTNAAGAVAYVGQADKAIENRIDPERYLANNDSNGFFNASNSDDLIVCGSTGTNFMDLHVLLLNFK